MMKENYYNGADYGDMSWSDTLKKAKDHFLTAVSVLMSKILNRPFGFPF
jgi:hypothetical protein